MTEQKQIERDFAIAWCGSKSADYNFTPDMLLAFAKEYEQLKQGSKLPMHDVVGRSEQLVLFSRFISNNSKLTTWMTSEELLAEFKKQN